MWTKWATSCGGRWSKVGFEIDRRASHARLPRVRWGYRSAVECPSELSAERVVVHYLAPGNAPPFIDGPLTAEAKTGGYNWCVTCNGYQRTGCGRSTSTRKAAGFTTSSPTSPSLAAALAPQIVPSTSRPEVRPRFCSTGRACSSSGAAKRHPRGGPRGAPRKAAAPARGSLWLLLGDSTSEHVRLRRAKHDDERAATVLLVTPKQKSARASRDGGHSVGAEQCAAINPRISSVGWERSTPALVVSNRADHR